MQLFTLKNEYLHLTLSDFGASWLSCLVKVGENWREVLVTTTPERWHQQTAYFGATVGRYANRIANARYTLNQQTYQLAPNHAKNNLHGGVKGADKQTWRVLYANAQAVRFQKIFADGEEGFGGEVRAEVEYRLEGQSVNILFDALSDQDTPLCLTNHAYFNLAGEGNVLEHQLHILAQEYLPVDAEGIPNGTLKSVQGSGFDFRQAKLIGQDLLADTDQQLVKGYDHAFFLAKDRQNQPACCLSVADLRLELDTSKPALQLYTGNWLSGQPDWRGGEYTDYAGVALEPEFLPDTPNHPEWWHIGGITRANQPYQHHITYRFLAE